MGVTGLWKLIESSGKPVPLETLENKILAIDISIWLHQVIKGFQDAKGGTLPNAHLLGLFHRLCKLLFYRIKPIFVFDGGIPALKRQTMAKRAESKNKLLNEADRLQSLLLSTLAKEKVVQQALGGTAVDILARSPIKALKTKSETEDMFKLPPIDEDLLQAGPSSSFTAELKEEGATTESKTAVHLTMHSIDVDSSNFKTLPADVRHEILTDMKETRKQNSWGRLHELPAQSDKFSSFQMQRLLKRRRVQVCLEDAEKEMGGQSLSVRDLEQLLTEEGVVAAAETNAKRIHSDDTTRFLMVTSIKQAMIEATNGEVKLEDGKVEKKKTAAELGPEFDEDLKRAVQMSLNEATPGGSLKAADEEGDGEIFMSTKQKENLTEAAKEMARAYMMEYAGMSNEDVKAILENDASGDEEAKEVKGVDETLLELIEKNELERAIAESLKEKERESGDSDSDLEEVVMMVEKEEQVKEVVRRGKTPILEIVIDPSQKIGDEEEDLFADVFGVEKVEKKSPEKDEFIAVVEDIDDSSSSDEEVTLIEVVDKDKEMVKVDDKESNENCDTNLPQLPIVIQSPSKYPSTTNPETVLKSLEEQKAAVLNITLDDIEEPSSPSPPPPFPDNSIIEIPSSPESSETPSKKRVLTDYFETTPRKTPKPTPEKDATPEVVPYVKSPFFVKKTPRKSSEKKQQLPIIEPPITANKATKFLFAASSADDEPSTSTEALLEEASTLLKSQKTATELETIAGDLRRQNVDLEQERNKQSRFGTSITERMSRECQEMLQLFGVPFIVAPMEAEAQCAFLNEAGLTHGTVTDDSDVWLFGGATVYKNFFDQKKHVLEFRMTNIERLFHVDRRKLIQLAMLVGSDYTPGITGIGAVTGMEILAQFATGQQAEEKDGSTGEYQAMVAALRRFREWWSNGGAGGSKTSSKSVLRNKLKNITIGEGFPSRAVIEAYLHPCVDGNREEFTWGVPDAETIREFAKKNFGWTRARTDELLGPVLRKQEERNVQRSIRNYFNCSSPTTAVAALKMSKRVQRAVRQMDPDAKDGDGEASEGGAGKGRTKGQRKGKKIEEEEMAADSDCQVVEEQKNGEKKVVRKRKTTGIDTKDSSLPGTSKRQRVPKIPETKQVIPQRDRTRLEEEERKRKAAEIFKLKNK